jgi:hypothetical protein
MQTLNNLQFPGKTAPGSYIGRGLLVMRNLFRSSGRRNVPRSLVVVIAGLSTDDIATPANELRVLGTDIFCISLGNLNGELQMHSIASTPDSEHMFSASFSQLGFIAQNIFTKILKGKKKFCILLNMHHNS